MQLRFKSITFAGGGDPEFVILRTERTNLVR